MAGPVGQQKPPLPMAPAPSMANGSGVAPTVPSEAASTEHGLRSRDGEDSRPSKTKFKKRSRDRE
jgi:hypothetical protein